MTPVAIPIAPESKSSVATTVAKDADAIFTILFPIKIVTSNRRGFFLSACTFFARFTPFFTIVSIFVSDREI